MSQSGFIYFASNPAMPGLLKIGSTNQSPWDRLSDLHTTGVPQPFIFEAFIRVANPIHAEQRIHSILAKWRESPNREFFRISVQDALVQCVPKLTEFLVVVSNEVKQTTQQSLSEIEEEVLLFIFRRKQKNDRPKRWEIESKFKFTPAKIELVLGSLSKRRFVREIVERRQDDDEYRSYKVKVVNLEAAGIKYLLDQNRISTADLESNLPEQSAEWPAAQTGGKSEAPNPREQTAIAFGLGHRHETGVHKIHRRIGIFLHHRQPKIQ